MAGVTSNAFNLLACILLAVFGAAHCNYKSTPSIYGEYQELFDEVEVEWKACSLYPGEDDEMAQCASVEVPYYWDSEHEESFTIAVKRLLAKGESSAQMWMLHGGPGASGTLGFPPYMERYRDQNPELDIYTIDPRGSGDSEYIGCPEQEKPMSENGEMVSHSEFDACLEYVEDNYSQEQLAVFGTTYAAIDVAAMVYKTRIEGKKVFLWGASGGTFWINRILTIFPDLVDGAILIGNEPPDGSIVFQDEYHKEIITRLLDLCGENPVCNQKLGGNPNQFLIDLLVKLENGHCQDLGLTARMAKDLISGMDYYYPQNALLPAFLYRWNRCDAADIAALYTAVVNMFAQDAPEHYYSNVLFFNESYSELWKHESFDSDEDIVAYLDSVYEDTAILNGEGFQRHGEYLKWPVYADPNDDVWADTDIPLLFLQGELDPATPYEPALELSEVYNGPNQHFVAFPYGAHNANSGTPIEKGPNSEHCGEIIQSQFIENPKGELDLSCIDLTFPPDFSGDSEMAQTFFGEPDMFENDGEKASELALEPASLGIPLINQVNAFYSSSMYLVP